MERKINTFIFDCFGVVCDSVLSNWYKDKIVKRGLKDENLKNVFEQFDLGKLTEEDIITYFLKYEGINSTREELREEIDSYLKLDELLADAIMKLKEKGFKTLLLSNANAAFFHRKIYTTYP